jgi:outer membrane immunogenic protein
MKIKLFIAASVIALAAATSARAADVVAPQEPAPPEPVAAQGFSWTGAYLGGQVGYGWAKSKFWSAYDALDDADLKPKGFLGGVFAGYNWQAGNDFVVGVDGDFNYARVKKSDYGFDEEDNTGGGWETKLTWGGAVRARAGYAVDRFLPYIAGGVAFGQVKHSLDLIDPAIPGGGAHENFRKTHVGWTAGAGVDYAATDNIFLRLEYRYTDLGDKSYTLIGESFKSNFKMHEVRLGVAYKF